MELIIGIIFLALGFLSIYSNFTRGSKWIEVNALVVEIKKIRDTTERKYIEYWYHPVVEFRTEKGEKIVTDYKSQHKHASPYKVGDFIKAFYSVKHPSLVIDSVVNGLV